MKDYEIRQQKIVLFDGVCNLCTGSILFILRREANSSLQFASIQSNAGKELLKWAGLSVDYDQAIIYLENGKIRSGSTAALKIGLNLVFPWSILSRAGLLIPRLIRDAVYNKIARSRYRWFGRMDICMVPTKELQARFL